MVGTFIRRTIGKGELNVGPDALPIRTFRVRHGNGKFGTVLGEIIQDQYAYFVPWPNGEMFPDSTRTDFAAAVASWKALSDPDKAYWNAEAVRRNLFMSGFNLYIKTWRLGLL